MRPGRNTCCRLSAGLALILCGLCIFPGDLRAQSLVIHWNSAALQGIRDAKLGAPKVARTVTIDLFSNRMAMLKCLIPRLIPRLRSELAPPFDDRNLAICLHFLDHHSATDSRPHHSHRSQISRL